MDEGQMRAMIRALKLDGLETLLHDEPHGNEADAISTWFEALAKQAIILDGLLRHWQDPDSTTISITDERGIEHHLHYPGNFFGIRDCKYLFIGLPLPPKEEA